MCSIKYFGLEMVRKEAVWLFYLCISPDICWINWRKLQDIVSHCRESYSGLLNYYYIIIPGCDVVWTSLKISVQDGESTWRHNPEEHSFPSRWEPRIFWTTNLISVVMSTEHFCDAVQTRYAAGRYKDVRRELQHLLSARGHVRFVLRSAASRLTAWCNVYHQ